MSLQSTIINSKGVCIIDPSFHADRQANYHLSIQISSSYVMWCVLDIPNKKYIGLEYLPFDQNCSFTEQKEKLENLVNHSDHLKLKFKTVSCSIAHDKFTLVPLPLYSKDKAGLYLNFNIGLEKQSSNNKPNGDSKQVGADKLQNLEAVNVYYAPEMICSVIKRAFPSVAFMHHASPLIESLLLSCKNKNSNTVFINFQKGEFGIALIENNQLKLYNSFHYETKEDFVYYVLFAFEQLKLNPETIELVVLGELDRDSSYFQLLYKYVRNINLISKPETFDYCYGLKELPGQYFYNLYCQYQCV